MVEAVKEAKAAKPAVEFKDGFYHFGMLPCQEAVDPKIALKVNVDGTPVAPSGKMHPFDIYSNDTGAKIFVTKSRYFDNIGVRNFVFPSLTKAIEPDGDGLSISSYAGQIAWLRGPQVKAIVESCSKHFIRFTGRSARIIDAEHGTKPFNMTDEEWMVKRVGDVEEFDPTTDKYVSEFVYLVRLPDEKQKEIDRNSSDYLINPNKYHQMVAPKITREWFNDPPKSVSELYPRG